MKHTRRIASLLLALVMVFAMAISASAASITITPPATTNGTEAGITYTAYKVFDATISGTSVAYTIESTSPYFAVVQNSGYFTLTKSASSETTYTVVKTDSYTNEVADTFADTLKAVAGVTAAGTLTKQTDGTYKLDGLADGYYLVTSSVGSDLILDTIGDISVTTKNEYPGITKTVDDSTADQGQVLTFTIPVTIPADAVGEIVVHDTMTNLTYQNWTAIDGISIDTAPAGDCGCSIHFTLTENYVATNKGTTINIVYTALFGAEAIANNEVYLVDSTYTSKPVEVEILSTDIIINKVDATDNTKPLQGATFVLYKEVTEDGATEAAKLYYKKDSTGNVSWVSAQSDATPVTTDASGKAQFDQLHNGTYFLLETAAPVGYNLLTAPVEVNVTATKTTTTIEGATVETVEAQTVQVENSTGSTLPSTGGMGTTLFYIVGGLMVAAAVVLLVTKKRMASAE